MTTRYVPNPAFVPAVSNTPAMSAAMVAIATEAMGAAESMAPHGATGKYAQSFRTLPVVVKAGRDGSPRAGAMIVNTSEHAAYVEWRNGRAVLARALRQVDGRVHGAERANVAATKRATATRRRRMRQRRRPSQP